jgi:hypothetical protein
MTAFLVLTGLGVFFFLLLTGIGLCNYLSGKNNKATVTQVKPWVKREYEA